MPAPGTRQPAVAGRFYPGDGDALAAEVSRLLGDTGRAARAVGAVVPHAGYVYSGGVAGKTVAALEVPGRVVVLAPNHTGRGKRISVMSRGAYRIPGAELAVDAELARRILAEVPGAEHDVDAHEHEHAVEVVLPFLHARRPGVKIVPIVLGGLDAARCDETGRGLARAIGTDEVLVIASSDMSHYLPDAEARRRDQLALGPLLQRDGAGLLRTCRDNDVTMCGVVPAAVMLAYAHASGASDARLVDYATSADASGDTSRVVGYAGVVVS